jgi:UrcA family protein
MSRSILVAAATAAVTAAMPQAPAAAQNPSIIVSAPAIRGAGEPANGAHQRLQLVTDVTVDYTDLDLRTAYGRTVLDQRMRIAADAACDRLDSIDPPTGIGASMNADWGDCRQLAFRKAEPQMRRAIVAAG